MAALSTKPKHRASVLPHYSHKQEGNPLVLVVEDHEDTLFLLTYLLGMRGCRVLVAKDGEQAVRLATSERPNLVLMDISLPRLDGLTATRRMREVETLRSVPVVFLSGHAEASFRAEALAQGGDDYLVKPFTVAQLEQTVERFIGKKVTSQG
jgi:CheY-like chemotaxis protein